ncbi:MAG: serine/threonine protein kinase [Planctomycetes bacterium]|nr:serine/threonine protein kinase [Planctomycetota bacterium]
MQRIGIYEVVRPLGQGGMGAVYEVRHPEISRRLAVKVLSNRSSPEALERFTREAELLARLRHPNVVSVHDFQPGPPPFLVTELVDGEDLARQIASSGPWEAKRAALVMRSLADGVAAIHAQGILHRDLKPENVILRPTGEPVLLDFGVARDESAERLTRTGALVGTPSFMSPEQIAGRRDLQSPATDVYGLGALLYSLLAGLAPFAECSTLAELMAAVVQRPPTPLDRLVPGLPRDLVAVTEKCLAKAPEDRYPTVEALREDLDRVLAGESALGSLGKRRLPLAAFLTLALLALGALVASVMAPTEDPPSSDPSASVEPSATRPAWEPVVRPLETLSTAELRGRVAVLLDGDLDPATRSVMRRLLRARQDLDFVEQLLGDPLSAQRDGRLVEWLKRYGETFPRLAARPTKVLALRKALGNPSSVALRGSTRALPPVWGEFLVLAPFREPGTGSFVRFAPGGLELTPVPTLPPLSSTVIRGGTLVGVTRTQELLLLDLEGGRTWSPKLSVEIVRLRRVSFCGERLLLAGDNGMLWTTPAKAALEASPELTLRAFPSGRGDVGDKGTQTTGLHSLAGGDFLLQLVDGGMGASATFWDLRGGAQRGEFLTGTTRAAIHPDGRRFALGNGPRVDLCSLEAIEARTPLIASDSPVVADIDGLGSHPRTVRDIVFAGDFLLTTCEFPTYTDLRAWRLSDQALIAVVKIKPRYSKFLLYQGRFLVAISSQRSNPEVLLSAWDLSKALSGESD